MVGCVLCRRESCSFWSNGCCLGTINLNTYRACREIHFAADNGAIHFDISYKSFRNRIIIRIKLVSQLNSEIQLTEEMGECDLNRFAGIQFRTRRESRLLKYNKVG